MHASQRFAHATVTNNYICNDNRFGLEFIFNFFFFFYKMDSIPILNDGCEQYTSIIDDSVPKLSSEK